MKRVPFSRFGVAGSLVGGLVFVSFAAPTGAGAAQSPAQGLASCVGGGQSGRTLNIVALVDQSGSIASNDPRRDSITRKILPVGSTYRAMTLKAALAGLAESADPKAGATGTRVNVLIAGFSGDYRPQGGWTQLTRANLGTVDRLVDEVAAKDREHNTDYVKALRLAREDLLRKDSGADVCRALITFSDGGYKLMNPDETKRLTGKERAGLAALCAPDGPLSITNYATSQIYRFVVALTPPRGLSLQERDFLQRISTGRRGCGKGISSRNGELLVGDGPRLFITFGDLLSNVVGKLIKGDGEFETNFGIQRFVINSYTPSGRITLRAPDKVSTLDIEYPGPSASPESTGSLGGAKLSIRWTGSKSVRIEADLPIDSENAAGSEPLGIWKFSFPSAQSRDSLTRVALYANLRPALVTPEGESVVPRASRGGYLSLKIRLMALQANGELKPVTTGRLLDLTELKSELIDPYNDDAYSLLDNTKLRTVRTTNPGEFYLRSVKPIPFDLATPTLRLTVTPQFRFGPKIQVTPEILSSKLEVVLPEGQGYPTVTASPSDLGDREGTGKLSGEIVVTADKGIAVGTGRACFGQARADGPDSSESYPVTLGASGKSPTCVEVAAGKSVRVPVVVDVKRASLGSLQLSVPVRLSSPARKGQLEQSLRLTAHVRPASDPFTHWSIVLVLVALGLILPLACLHGLNYLNSGFQRPETVYVKRADVTLGDEGLSIANSGEGDSPSSFAKGGSMGQGVELVGAVKDRRRIVSIPGLELRSSASGRRKFRTASIVSIFQGPFGTAKPTAGGQVISGSFPSQPSARRWADGTLAEVPLSLAGSWVFVPSLGHGARTADAGSEEGDDLSSVVDAADGAKVTTDNSEQSAGGGIDPSGLPVEGVLYAMFNVFNEERLDELFQGANSVLSSIDWLEERKRDGEVTRDAESDVGSGRARPGRGKGADPSGSKSAGSGDSDTGGSGVGRQASDEDEFGLGDLGDDPTRSGAGSTGAGLSGSDGADDIAEELGL